MGSAEVFIDGVAEQKLVLTSLETTKINAYAVYSSLLLLLFTYYISGLHGVLKLATGDW
jgi:hypothetical protein